jgi:hypothetical protein
MKNHSEKQNPASKPSTKSMLNAGLDRAGDPAYADHKPSDKLTRQSAGARRKGETQYADYPDKPRPSSHESTGNDGAGSRRGSR